jgi:hypothetical protein
LIAFNCVLISICQVFVTHQTVITAHYRRLISNHFVTVTAYNIEIALQQVLVAH